MTLSPPQDGLPGRQRYMAIATIAIGLTMAVLDGAIANVALPTIRTSLAASEATLSWIISGYALAFGLALIPAGRVGDRIGHKWVFFTGIALFTLASKDGVQLRKKLLEDLDKFARQGDAIHAATEAASTEAASGTST